MNNLQNLLPAKRRDMFSEGWNCCRQAMLDALTAADLQRTPSTQALDAVTLLREIEWENNRYSDSCPVCGESKKDGHSAACKLDAVLRCR